MGTILEKNKEEERIKTLADNAVSGDLEAFEELCKVKSRSILYNAMLIMRNQHDAEDAAQEVFLKMFKNIGTLKSPDKVNAWIQKIVSNVSLDIIKSRSRRKEDYSMENEDIIESITEVNTEFLPHEYYEDTEKRNLIMDIINTLPMKRRRALCLYYYDGLSYKEIAYVMDSSVSAISTNISRAKVQLKEEIEKRNGTKLDKLNIAPASAVSAVPVLSQVMRDDSVHIFSDEIVRSVTETSVKSVTSTSKAYLGKTATTKSISHLFLKIIAGVLISTIVVTAGVVTFFPDSGSVDADNADIENVTPANNDQRESIKDLAEKIEIKFLGGDCDCGHFNPAEIVLENTDSVAKEISYEIAQDEKDNVLYKGTGSSTGATTKELYNLKKDGDYKIIYKITDENGNTIKVDHVFSIDTEHEILFDE